MRLLSLIIISSFLLNHTLLAQEWGTKMDTVYGNSFDGETEDLIDTLYNQSYLEPVKK